MILQLETKLVSMLTLYVVLELVNALPNCGTIPTTIKSNTGTTKSNTQQKSMGVPYIKDNREEIVATIGGGDFAMPFSWPWVVKLCKIYDSDLSKTCSHVCGGTVIDERWILSSAHCKIITDKLAGKWFAKLGVFDSANLKELGVVVLNISEIVTHPNYSKPFENSNDIALFKVVGKIEFTNHIQPICLPNNGTNLNKKQWPFVIGWGRTSEKGESSSILRQVQVPFLDMKECIKEYGQNTIDETMECAGKEGIDACQGDSGGPLMTKHSDGRWFHIGIVSWGNGCGKKGFAGVYSKPAANCEFIAATIGYEICQ